jgi:glycosyltransferase involved in cell wall biosynthesis
MCSRTASQACWTRKPRLVAWGCGEMAPGEVDLSEGNKANAIKAFVHLAYNFSAQNWNQNYENGTLLGINDPFAYGYHRAAEFGFHVEYSEDKPENKIETLFRFAIRYFLKFDFVHAWRNRKGIYDANVIWTHTESQCLAVLLLFLFLRPKPRPKLIAQTTWLFDRWWKFPAPNRWLCAKLLSKADVLTFHSPENLKVARQLLPQVRSELILYGIRAEEKIPPQLRAFHNPIRIISLGNDEHRDWATLIEAVRNWKACELRIASYKICPRLVAGATNIEIVRARSNSELLQLYDWADLAVVALKPNMHASGITVAQEAAVRGVPLICSETGGLKAYFSDEEVKYVPVLDPQGIRRAIEQTAEDDQARWARAKRAQARMGPEGLSAHAYVKRHAELSRELLGLT